MESVLHVVRSLGVVRLVAIGAVLLLVTGFFVVILTRMSGDEYALLYSDLDATDSAQIVRTLERQGVPYQLTESGKTIHVPADLVPQTRMQLADAGLPSGGSMGYELFDDSDAFGTTNFMQNVNLVRALEGELARTIRAIDGVRAARVHLVLPKRELFSRQRQDPSASIVLTLASRRGLAAGQVVAIQNLVASAVPGLQPNRISVVDASGNLLAGGFEGADGGVSLSSKSEEHRVRYETHLASTIERLLERTVGPGRVRAEVTADMDFDRINTSEETYDPDGQVVRSSQSVEAEASSREGAGEPPVSVATNLPDPGFALNEGESAETTERRLEEVVNYEISKRVVNHVREAGVVNRLSVAVLVDGLYGTDAEGNAVYEPRSQDEINLLASLVRGAVGFNAERGDTVEVINMRFVDLDPIGTEGIELLFGLNKQDLLKFAQYLVLCIFALLVILLVIRPLLARTLEALPMPATGPMGDLLTHDDGTPALTGPETGGLMARSEKTPDDSQLEEMIDLDRVEGRVRASTVNKVGEIVSKHPDEAISILRNWLHQDD
jgi:flagellar M-ring protein FliF